jgi:hypothetical protein
MPSSNIHVLDNFVTDSDIDTIMSMALSVDLWNEDAVSRFDKAGNVVYDANDWIDTTCGADLLFIIDPLAYLLLEAIAMKVMCAAENLFNCRLLFREPSLVRYTDKSRTGQLHADKENIDGTPKLGMEDYDVSAVIYHNSDFTGGDLVFPQHDARVAPSPGKVVIFPGDATHLHYVDTITSGIRWSSPLFFSVIR